MILIFVVTLLICLTTWIYIRWVKVRKFWKIRGVPHSPPHPIYGSLTFLQRKNTGIWMSDMYKKFKSPYVGIWLFWRPALIINSPEIAKNVLVKDFVCFRDRFLSSGSSDPIGSLNLFTTNDPLWSSLRRRLTSTFTSSKLKTMQPLVSMKSSELVQRIRNTEDKTKISLRYLFTDYTTDIFATAAFGIKTDATLTGKDPMRTVTTAFMEFDTYRGLNWISIFFIPKLVSVFRFSFFPKWATDYFTRVFKIASEQRISHPHPDTKDLLDVLLKMKEESTNNNEEISDDIIVAQAAIFLLGGFETSGSVLSFATYELAFNQDIQEKLYNELKDVQVRSDGNLEMSKLAELPYLNAIIKETLRKFSPMGWLDRVAAMDYKVDDNLTIPAGTPIYVNAIGMQHDPDLFPDPETFNPDRFLPENEKDIKQFTYLPFGEGPRNCIGKRFGQISVRHGLANLILNYKITPLPGTPNPNEVELEKQGLFLVPGQHLHINFVPRNKD